MRPSTSHRYLERIERVVDALLSAPADAHSVESLAAVANMSAYHFHRVFRAVMGETVNATMRRVRLSLAADRLAHCAESVGRIAESAGYESPQAFSRAFRGFTRTAPAEYRRRYLTAGRAVRQRLAVGTAFDGTIIWGQAFGLANRKETITDIVFYFSHLFYCTLSIFKINV